MTEAIYPLRLLHSETISISTILHQANKWHIEALQALPNDCVLRQVSLKAISKQLETTDYASRLPTGGTPGLTGMPGTGAPGGIMWGGGIIPIGPSIGIPGGIMGSGGGIPIIPVDKNVATLLHIKTQCGKAINSMISGKALKFSPLNNFKRVRSTSLTHAHENEYDNTALSQQI
jgi:hypothetical protein